MNAILLLSCPDQRGLVSRISHFIYERGGNILDLDEHVDPEDHLFFIRVAWNMDKFTIPADQLAEAFFPLGKEFKADWDIRLDHRKQNVALFVSKYDHCLQEILWRHQIGEFGMNIPLIISNHSELQDLADHYQIPYHVFPIDKSNKSDQEKKELKLLEENNIDTIVLARYMQIISSQIVDQYPHRIINIHHSFLPAFIGGNPYKQAYQRGVKIIGATSHYVTTDLDEGPIIEQDTIRISHKDTLKDLVRKGRDLERLVLARALHHHLEDRVLVNGHRTIIFE